MKNWKNFYFSLVSSAILVCLSTIISFAAIPKNALPPDADRILQEATQVTLYSLEDGAAKTPKNNLHGYPVLGKTELQSDQAKNAVKAFRDAISGWNGSSALCFEPHYALTITSEGHNYDYLICYLCQSMEVYKDGKMIGSVGITGSPNTLNSILTTAKVPLSHIYNPEYMATEKKRREDGQKKIDEASTRWRAAMPSSLQPLWADSFYHDAFTGDSNILKPFNAALEKEFPSPDDRIAALLKWYGSGEGPWSGYASYEDIPGFMLMDYSTDEIIKTLQKPQLSEQQLEGADRFFTGWNFSRKRPKDLETLPPELKKILLEHSLKTADKNKISIAKKVFQ